MEYTGINVFCLNTFLNRLYINLMFSEIIKYAWGIVEEELPTTTRYATKLPKVYLYALFYCIIYVWS